MRKGHEFPVSFLLGTQTQSYILSLRPSRENGVNNLDNLQPPVF